MGVEYKVVDNLTGKGYQTVIEYHEDGSIKWQSWYLDGKHHRVDAPACIAYREKRYGGHHVWYEQWFVNGCRHREDGTSVAKYKKDGSIDYQRWHLRGHQILKPDFTYEMVVKMKAQELFTPLEIAKLRYECLNTK